MRESITRGIHLAQINWSMIQIVFDALMGLFDCVHIYRLHLSWLSGIPKMSNENLRGGGGRERGEREVDRGEGREGRGERTGERGERGEGRGESRKGNERRHTI